MQAPNFKASAAQPSMGVKAMFQKSQVHANRNYSLLPTHWTYVISFNPRTPYTMHTAVIPVLRVRTRSCASQDENLDLIPQTVFFPPCPAAKSSCVSPEPRGQEGRRGFRRERWKGTV